MMDATRMMLSRATNNQLAKVGRIKGPVSIEIWAEKAFRQMEDRGESNSFGKWEIYFKLNREIHGSHREVPISCNR